MSYCNGVRIHANASAKMNWRVRREAHTGEVLAVEKLRTLSALADV